MVYCLESTKIIDLFFLHYIFCPRINHQLSLFVEAWNHRPPRTERSWTPQQNNNMPGEWYDFTR